MTGAVLLLALAAGVADAPAAARRTAAPVAARGAFALFATTNLVLSATRVQCNINAIGEWCVDGGNSPVVGGGFWPRGTPDQYVFNGGLRVAAIIPYTQPPEAWAGDTVGAFFFDARGDQAAGSPVTFIYDSRATAERDWPTAAFVLDTALFHATLIGRQAASQQDSWVRYWDVSANLRGRAHQMGLLVEQRSLAWNYPVGNDDIVYQIFRLINVTAADPARYAGLADAGYSAADIASIAELGRVFKERMRIEHEVTIPDAGHTFTRLYVDYGEDQDVGNAGANFTNASLVFDLMAAYKSNFSEPGWVYPPEIFFTPLAAAPGFAGQAYVRTPGDTGIALWTNTTGGGGLPDRQGVAALWRAVSANILPSDGTCSVPRDQVQARRFCQSVQSSADSRGYMSTGPFTLAPGQAVTIVMAKLFAAPAASLSCNAGEGACPGGAWSLTPFVGGSMPPGYPVSGSRLVQGLDTVRNFDRAMGWISGADTDADGAVEWNEVTTVPRSLLWKAQLARAMVANRFITPQPPAAPRFFVLPGDGKVSVVWEASATEATGDPYFAAASDAATPLYDPSYREFDVEGYCVWRGTSPDHMQLVAQFDYPGTSITDYSGQFSTSSACAPELGVTTTCPALPRVVPLTEQAYGLLEPIVQVRPGDRVLLANNLVSVIHADTLVIGGGSGMLPLRDSGVPFVFTDSGLANGVTYYYAVSAFDANSWKSGPSSFESERVVRVATPRVRSSNPVSDEAVVIEMVGGDGAVLDSAAPFPAMNTNGTLAGPIPPANAGSLSLLNHVPELLQPGDYFARIDSVGPGFGGQFSSPLPRFYMSFLADTAFRATTEVQTVVFNSAVTQTAGFELESRLVPLDTARMQELGLDPTIRPYASVRFSGRTVSFAATGVAISFANGRYGAQGTTRDARFLAHSYWYDEGSAPPASPTVNPYPARSGHAGRLAWADTIYQPAAYRQAISGGVAANAVNPFNRGYLATAAAVWYPADFLVTWGAGGAITVRDSTHRTDLGFHTSVMTGYAFLDLDTLTAYGVTTTDLSDGTGTPSMTALSYHHLYATTPVCSGYWGITCAPLAPRAKLFPLDFNGDGVGDGSGIVLIVNGESFYLRMNALPPSGTKWHLVAYGGGAMTAACSPAIPAAGDIPLGSQPTSCNVSSYTPPANRPAYAPGLRFRIRVTESRRFERADAGDLSRVHPVPDPYYWTDALETQTGRQAIRFVNVPDRAIIRIYSTSGILVAMVSHNDPTGGGEMTWDVRSREGRPVASGVYFWHLVTADGRQKVGRMTVVNAAR